MNTIHILSNPIREYAWGSRTAIPELLGRPSPAETPQAELWLGAHPGGPSLAVMGERLIALDELIAASPANLLGGQTAGAFKNRLPYLMKILAAAKPLSIQVHPGRDLAREGFARENRLGVPLDAAHRNYRDDNHKPELLCAQTPFHLLKGFRSPERIMDFFSMLAGDAASDLTACLKQNSEDRALEVFFQKIMTLPESERTALIHHAMACSSGDFGRSSEYRWMRKLHAEYPGDIGILAPLFLNLLLLQPGQAVYLDAGTPHAYLEGVGIEVMANSDNVLRGGLTPKHVDVPELLHALCFMSQPVEPIHAAETRPGEFSYPTPAEEFALSVIRLTPEKIHSSPDEHSLDILLCVEGAAVLTCAPDQRIDIHKGLSMMIPAAAGTYRVSGNGVIYKTSVPLQRGIP